MNIIKEVGLQEGVEYGEQGEEGGSRIHQVAVGTVGGRRIGFARAFFLSRNILGGHLGSDGQVDSNLD